MAFYEQRRQAGDPEFSLARTAPGRGLLDQPPVGLPIGAGKPALPDYTARQGQYLAFIHYYTRLNGIAPAEADMQHYFKVSPPSVHEMILTLERKGFITRTPGVSRSIQLKLPREQLPDLE